MKRRPKLLIWAMMAILFYVLIVWAPSGPKSVTTSEFIQNVTDGKYVEVRIEGGSVFGMIDEKTGEHAVVTDQETLQKILLEKKVKFNEVQPSNWIAWLPTLFLMGIVIAAIIMVRRAASGGGNMINRVQKNKATLYENNVKTRFSDVAGADEAVDESREMVEYLQNPTEFTTTGGTMPKGMLLIGPSGTGKTLLARAIAGEAGVSFLSASGSEFVEMFVGVGASRVRDLFQEGKKRAPCIIFIDEIDAVGQARGGVNRMGGHDEREQTLNQLLVEMDGFEENVGVLLIAATNRPEVLDSALRRPGRFDRTVTVPVPDRIGREAILKVHAKRFMLGEDVDLGVMARATPGMTGADLASLLNEASLHAGRLKKPAIDMGDMEFARDKVFMGPARTSQILSEETLSVIAFHECGHTIAGWFTPAADPLHKVTIIPRGQALGLTWSLPLEDRTLYRKSWLLAQLRLLMGGRVAEEIAFGDVSSGAGDDLKRATEIARKMVKDLGMSELGNRTFGVKSQGVFLDYGNDSKDYSERTQQKIDDAVDALLQKAYEDVKNLLTEKSGLLNALASRLREEETLDEAAVAVILGPRPLPDNTDSDT